MTRTRGTVLPFRRPASDREAAFETSLRDALARNPRIANRARSRVHVVEHDAANGVEALVSITRVSEGNLVGHAFQHARTGIAYAIIVLIKWELPDASAASAIADYRRQTLDYHRFAPVHAAHDGAVYAEAPNAAAAIHRLARMVEMLDPRTAVPGEEDEISSYIDVRVIAPYWDPASPWECGAR